MTTVAGCRGRTQRARLANAARRKSEPALCDWWLVKQDTLGSRNQHPENVERWPWQQSPQAAIMLACETMLACTQLGRAELHGEGKKKLHAICIAPEVPIAETATADQLATRGAAATVLCPSPACSALLKRSPPSGRQSDPCAQTPSSGRRKSSWCP